MMTTLLSQQDPLALRQTKVSNPAVIHTKASQQSLAASDDYFSLAGSSGSSTHSADTIQPVDRSQSKETTRPVYSTPPSRFRSPLQSQEGLPAQAQGDSQVQHAGATGAAVINTPLRGHGTRRQSHGSWAETGTAEVVPATPSVAVLKEGGIRRKPVSSVVMDSSQDVDGQHAQARSSIARDIARDPDPPTPDDDTPYIRFALDQLTRDEEVRGSRRYPGYDGSGSDDERYEPYTTAAVKRSDGYEQPMQQYDSPPRTLDQPATEQWPTPQRPFDEPIPRNQKRDPAQIRDGSREPEVLLPVASDSGMRAPLTILPAILRPLSLALFAMLVLLYLGLLLAAAILSLLQKGIFPYGSLGDAHYFICQYLPSLLGMGLFLWLVQIEAAVHRTAPFIAMCSNSPDHRHEGTQTPLYPCSFFLPCFEHFYTGQPVVFVFLTVSWLQIFSVPLLGSIFNVYYYGPPHQGNWHWLATQGPIWTVIGLYILLFTSTVALLLWIRKQETGLRWDATSLADIIVLLERSNALSSEDDKMSFEAGRLGYWRTTGPGNTIFHGFGIANKPARQYGVENGRIVEKAPASSPEPVSRFSDVDLELGEGQRSSREKMLPKQQQQQQYVRVGDSSLMLGRALPRFLQPVVALFWPIIAVVLLIAFLVVSYLPSTNVLNGFTPMVPSEVDKLGYSGTNLLFSLVPSTLAMICFLGWLDIDYAHRRLQPYVSLLQPDGEFAERSLLLSYPADLPIAITIRALVNGHVKIAFFSFVTLIAATLPILAGGLFWAEFSVPAQKTLVYVQPAAYYALTTFLVIYALAYLLVFPSHTLRNLDRSLPSGNRAKTFGDILDLVRSSRILDDVAFHDPRSKIDLVTRLLSAVPGASSSALLGRRNPNAAASKMSLADSVRGFGKARQHADEVAANGVFEVPRYYLGRYDGRDGRGYVGIDRMRK